MLWVYIYVHLYYIVFSIYCISKIAYFVKVKTVTLHEMTKLQVPTVLFASRLRCAVSVLQRLDDEEEEEDVFPDILRTGLYRFTAGGGFNLSPGDTAVPSGFFTFSGPE